MAMVYPPNEVFAHPAPSLAQSQGGYGTQGWKQDICPPEGGLFAYYHDEPYPRKGHTYPEACEANNLFKKMLVGNLASLAAKEATLPLAGFLLLPYKSKVKWLEKILSGYVRLADYANRNHYMRRRFYNNVCKELWDLTYHALRQIGISPDVSYRAGRIVAHMLEHDDAYRARLQDILSEMDYAKMMKIPRKELARLMQIYVSREELGITEKFTSFAKLLSYLLLVPKIRKIFIETLRQAKLVNLVYDEIDYYYVLNRSDYKYLGRDLKDRFTEYRLTHNRYVLTHFRKEIEAIVTDDKGKEELKQQLIAFGLT